MIIDGKKNKRVFASLSSARDNFRKGINVGLHEIGSENVRHLRKLIRDKNKNGRLYFFRGRIHQASAPGEAPANMTGNLARSATYKVRAFDSVEFGDTAFYGPYLEDGTKVGGKWRIKPRPHVKRVVKEKQKDNYNSLALRVKNKVAKL